MPVLIKAHVGLDGWATIRFAYNKEAKDRLKEYPGVFWDPEIYNGQWKKPGAWRAPYHLMPVLCGDSYFKVDLSYDEAPEIEIPPPLAERLKPYQLEGVRRILSLPGYMITFEPRVGKTPTAITALCSLFAASKIDLALLLMPNVVIDVWRRELAQWAEIEPVVLETFEPLLTHEVAAIHARDYPTVICSYEILSHRENCLARLVDGKRYAVCADEAQLAKNRKAKRTQVMQRLARGRPIIKENEESEDLHELADGESVSRVELSGTPMRNRPRDLFCLFDFILPGSMGWGPKFKLAGSSRYADRYCDGHVDEDGHYTDKGKSNEEELALRLEAASYRVTRREAAPWLPKCQRQFIPCAAEEAILKRYREIESAYATKIGAALGEIEPSHEDREILRQLSNETARAKIPKCVERVLAHLDRGVKVLVKAYHHDPVKAFFSAFRSGQYHDGRLPEEFPIYFAGGSETEANRREAIERWKTVDCPAVLVVNLLSSGVGIDLSDAEVSIALDLAWVPADHLQGEDRQVKIHGGTRMTAPLHEILFVRDTIDTAMASTLIEKIGMIEAIVGEGEETTSLSSDLRAAGVVRSGNLGLANTDADTVKAALNSMRDRILFGKKETGIDDKLALAAEVASLDDEDEGGADDE